MQISKLVPAVCTVALCASFIAARAQDSPAQAAARAALMEKMSELEAQPAKPAPPPVVVTSSGATQVKTSQPTNIVMAPPPAIKAHPAVPAAETNSMANAEAQVRARAALNQKTSDLNQQNWATPAVTPPASPAPQTRPVAVSPVKPAPPAVKPETLPPAKQINPNYPGKELGLKPMTAPSLPISAAQQAQLQALLQKYQADQITPEKYQTERARILAQP